MWNECLYHILCTRKPSAITNIEINIYVDSMTQVHNISLTLEVMYKTVLWLKNK